MYLLYSLLLIFWGLLLLPFFLYKAWRYHKYLPGMGQRFGRLPIELSSDRQGVIWFHSCSVGETLSLQPLVSILRQRLPEVRFVFSTITKTGQEVAIKQFGAENTFYFPIDFAFIIRRAFQWLHPTLIVIIDTEIWPNLIHQARRWNIPVIMANGRISPASFRYYRWARPALRKIFRNYESLMMQSAEDAVRITRIGAPKDKVTVPGNLKFDRDLIKQDSIATLRRDLEDNFGLGHANGLLIVAGSTHPGEEKILFEVLRSIRSTPNLERTRLLLAPRHPERFNEVEELAAQAGFAVRRRSHRMNLNQDTPILLLDTLGELAEVYHFATLVFVGGTLVRHGGHSILEPAAFSKPIVIGPSMENFRSICDEFHAHEAIRQITAGQDDPELQKKQLLEIIQQLLQNSEEREALGNAAFSILEKNRGAAQRISDRIAEVFQAADRTCTSSGHE
jgi:3-deoxy-D-manno-octulosonic-acid transferase